VKKVKKENITRENIHEIMLCQIPSISSQTAIELIKVYGTIQNLADSLAQNRDCLQTMFIEKEGKKRKLNKNVIENLQKYLL
jgi:5'-3' exonuclease